jgi:hypothetical protein
VAVWGAWAAATSNPPAWESATPTAPEASCLRGPYGNNGSVDWTTTGEAPWSSGPRKAVLRHRFLANEVRLLRPSSSARLRSLGRRSGAGEREALAAEDTEVERHKLRADTRGAPDHRRHAQELDGSGDGAPANDGSRASYGCSVVENQVHVSVAGMVVRSLRNSRPCCRRNSRITLPLFAFEGGEERAAGRRRECHEAGERPSLWARERRDPDAPQEIR